MEEYIFDCNRVNDPYKFLTSLLGVDKEDCQTIKRPVFIRVYSRDVGIKKFPEFIQFLETIQQESEYLYVICGPNRNG